MSEAEVAEQQCSYSGIPRAVAVVASDYSRPTIVMLGIPRAEVAILGPHFEIGRERQLRLGHGIG